MDKTIFKAELFHGGHFRKHFFEGWYNKIVSEDRQHAFAFIPGISYGSDRKDSHAFIQFFDGMNSRMEYFRFPIDAFSFSKSTYDIRIADSRFNIYGFKVNLKGENNVSGTIQYSNHFKWPRSFISPGAMGPFAFIPNMECYHGIMSMDHMLKGTLSVNGAEADMNSGHGYIEKDWGTSFPNAWVWLQSNSFEESGVSVMASIAIVPFMNHKFNGFIISMMHKGKLYRFTTYNLSRISKLQVNGGSFLIEVKNPFYKLIISGEQAEGAILPSPEKGNMTGKIKESLSSEIHIKLMKINGTIIFEGTGTNAGLEIVGNLKGIL